MQQSQTRRGKRVISARRIPCTCLTFSKSV